VQPDAQPEQAWAGTPTGLNPLVAAANPLLNLVPTLRTSSQHADPATLRERLAQALKTFEAQARAAQVAPEKILAGRYALCTLLDEAAASTPWGGSGVWAHHSLLVLFHNESWGGEKFFQLLSKLAENPAANRDLLELMYLCLAHGFQGRFAVAQDGRAQLDALRERLAQMLRQVRGPYEKELSPRWQGIVLTRRNPLGDVPLWAGLALGGVLLLGVYLVFSALLNGRSDPVYAQIQALRIAAPMSAAPAAPAAGPRLAQFLQAEIAAQRVTVRDNARESVVALRGDGLFAPGSAAVSREFEPLLARIADALAKNPGKVIVTGHSDNQPIRSLRYPSNWHLSAARAQAVADLLGARVGADRLRAEGRADAEPLAPNDTAAGRARNRRIEITLIVSADVNP
jgi:type VI secretion system protein ImpK